LLQADPDYVLIKRWVPEEVQDELWEHTRQIRSSDISSPQDGGRGRKLPNPKDPEKDQASDRKQNERNRIINVYDFPPPPPQQPLAYDPAPARPAEALESTKLRGSKSKASKSSGKVSSDASEIGSEASTAKKAKDANTSPLLNFLAGGKRR
jgi:hypothetical protein